MDIDYAKYLSERTKNNYDLTAEDYARSRAFIPDDLKSLQRYADIGDRVLDSGCASGRFYEVLENKRVDFYGIDFSEKLIGIAKEKYPKANFRVADARSAPFPPDYFDKVYSISVLHNIPSGEFRLEYLREMRRVLKPGGRLILRVWDFWRRREGWELFFKYAFLKLVGRSQLDFFDIFLPWKDSKGETVAMRYFHCFTSVSLADLVRKAGFTIRESWTEGEKSHSNIYIVAEK